jgi:glycosyltransferase involved in cell wall biosynthesis
MIKSYLLKFKKKIINKYYFQLYTIKVLLNKINDNNFLLNIYYSLYLNKLKKIPLKKTEPKKVFLVISDINYGGAEQQIIRLAYYLKKNYKVTIVSFCINKNKSNIIFNKLVSQYKSKIKIVYLECKNINKKYYEFTNRVNFFNKRENFFYTQFYQLVLTQKPSIIHSYLDGNNLIAGLVGYIFNIKTILSFRNTIPINFAWCLPYYKSIYKFLSQKKNIIFASNSKRNGYEYERWLGLNKNRVKLTNNIFNLKNNFNQIQKKRSKKINCLTICRFDPEKNLFYLIDLFKYLIRKNENINLNICGSGPLEKNIKNKINFYKLSNKIKLIKNRPNIKFLLKNTDIFFLVSKYEGVPNVLLEAQSYGIPIITTKIGGITECISNLQNGYFLEKNTIGENSEYILNLFKRKNFFIKRNKNQIKNQLKKFSSKIVIANIIKIYEKKIR